MDSDAMSARVAWLIPSAGYGGDPLYWTGLWREVSRRFGETRIFCPDVGTSGEIEGVQVDRLPCARLRISGRQQHDYVRWLNIIDPRAIFKVFRFRPQVIIVVEFGLLSMYGILVARSLGGCGVLLLVEADPKMTVGVGGRVRAWLRRRICRACDLSLVNNPAGRRYLVEVLGMRAERVKEGAWLTSEPPVCQDEGKAPSLAIGEDPSRLDFVCVGQLIERKGLRYLLAAIAALSGEDRQRARFWIIGDGPDGPKLHGMAAELGIGGIVRFAGKVPYGQLGGVYRRAGAFVLPTLHDYRALVGFEALAHGLPLLVSRHDGAAEEIVEDGQNGFRFEPRDTAEFSRLLAWMINNRSALRAFSARSRELSARFTLAAATDTLTDAVRECWALRAHPVAGVA